MERARITAKGQMTIPKRIRDAAHLPILDWRATGLNAPFMVRVKLFALEAALIVRRVGSLGAADRRLVGAALSQCLAVFA